jgi:hypothetical protein
MVELGGGGGGGPPGPPRIYATEYRNLFLKILDLGNTLVVEIQKGILLYSCHIVRKFLNIDTEHNTG